MFVTVAAPRNRTYDRLKWVCEDQVRQLGEMSPKQNRRRKLPWQKAGLARVERVIAFLQFLPITKGKLIGSNLELLPDQRAFIEDIYGRSGTERVRLGILSQPRGNGKSGLIAGLQLCHLLGPEAEVRGERYSAAIDRQQPD